MDVTSGSPSVPAPSRKSSGSLGAAFQGSPSSASASILDARPAHLDASALSPAEYAVFPQWLTTIKPSRSGEADHIDEQDALRFLRDECGIEVRDEIKILSLFERFPLGLLPGHFFALLRLAAWVQRGQMPSKALLFTQAAPPATRSDAGTSASPSAQARFETSSPRVDRHGRNLSVTSNKSPGASPRLRSVPSDAALLATPRASAQTQSAMLTPLVPVPSRQALTSGDVPPPVPDDSFKPHNPFRHAAPPIPASAVPHTQPQGIEGFDPAPNPFKHPTKPKVVRPTPIVANAATDVLRRPSPGVVDPFKSVASASSPGGSPVSGRSVADGAVGELKPPPLPPRHISPLIQAGLQARSEVRRRQELLPPKTFTVLQSTSTRHGGAEGPRLLTGQAAPTPTASSRRRADGGRISASSAHGAKSVVEESGPERRSGPLPTPIAPKPSYGAKGKTGIPAWLREQEELQKTSTLDDHNEPNAPPSEMSRTSKHSRRKPRTTSEAARIQFLDNDSESGSDDDTLSEQARSAASIDRNNPFFQHGRDHERHVDLKESLNKLAVENAVTKAERDSKMSARATSDTSTTRGENDSRRHFGRSKTLRDAMGRAPMSPPVIPPRKRNDLGPVPLNSGTYPGFGRSVRIEGPTAGGLRQTPVSRKAEVGLPAHVIAERERQHHNLSTSPQDGTQGMLRPPPLRRHASSNSQVSDSTTTGPRSPSDGPGAHDPRFDVMGSDKPTFEDLMNQHNWTPRRSDFDKEPAARSTTAGAPDNGEGDNDEPEVDEHYLAEKRKEVEQRMRTGVMAPQLASPWSWQQRGHSIDVIEEENNHSRSRNSSMPANMHANSDFQQRRATPDGLRRSASGASMGHLHLRRSSLLSRGGISAEDVDQVSDTDRTPRENLDGSGDMFVDALAHSTPPPAKEGEKGSSQDGDVESRHSKNRTKSSDSSSSASGRAGAVLTDMQRQVDGWQQLP